MNMKCTDIKRHIDDYLDRQLSSADRFSFEQHVADCAECAGKLKIARSLLTDLQNLPVPEPLENFEQRVFSEVGRQHKDSHREYHGYKYATGFAAAAVAGLAIWFVSSMYLPDMQIEQPQMISLAMNQMQTVRLMFDSHKDIQQAQLTIDLPDNMRLDGYPGRKALTWQTSLQKGQNILALPIIAVEQGQGELFARLSYGDTMKTFSVVLKATMDGVQSYQHYEVKSG